MRNCKVKIEAAKEPLCNHCLGRLYGMLGHGLDNESRGRAIRVMYAMENGESIQKEPENCAICEGIFRRVDDYARHITSLLKEYEFSTFSVGSKFSEDILRKEDEFVNRYSSEDWAERIGREFNRELGKKISELTGKEANLSSPDIAVIVDTEYDDVKLEIKPLFIYGRYRKLERGLPQTKWPSGKYKESVEQLIAGPIMEATEGEGHALHGLGREDIDVRMLGNGRPFILEIKRPKKRSLNLEDMQHEINRRANGRVEVMNLKFADRAMVRELKSSTVRKRYRVKVSVNTNEEELVSALEKLKGKIRQRTPKRVAHRRADRIRVREVYEIKLVGRDEEGWVIEVLAESGTYIKELMHGDDGRTKPSLSSLLNKDVLVIYLDVIEIQDNFP